MRMRAMRVLKFLLGGYFVIAGSIAVFAAVPQSPRVGNVEILADQGWASNPDTIWYDDFESSQPIKDRYLEYVTDGGVFAPITYESLGGSGRSMRARWDAGDVGVGNLKKTFGRNPMDYKGFAARPTEDFTEVYWRQYVKMQDGWIGQPGKLNRATSFAASDWSQAMIAHIWNGSSTNLKTDPVRAVNSTSQVTTTGYNDFPNFSWIGGSGAPSSNGQVFDTAETGRWVSVEGRVKLNTPGNSDGVFQLFIDGQLEVSRSNYNWVYSWNDYGINAVFVENWWNNGSPVEQERYIDDFVISTSYIGQAKSPVNPLVTKTSFIDPDGSDTQGAWQLQVASNPNGTDLVWDSGNISGAGLSVEVNDTNGSFQGSLASGNKLLGEQLYALRVRQKDNNGQWSGWSPWNTSLQTGLAPVIPGDFDGNNYVNGADFLLWQRDPSVGNLSDWETNYLGALSAVSAVPEPATAALAVLSVISLLARRRRPRRLALSR